MFTNTSQFTKSVLKATAKITIAGVFIGLLHQYDLIVALVLFAKVLFEIVTKVIQKKNYLFLIGMLLTGVAGLIGEHWGVTNDFWEYHDVPRELPYWLPFAWMLAFGFLYKLEIQTIPLLKDKSLKNKLLLTTVFVVFFPWFGEVITILLGVWTYYWPYQIIGVPLYAIGCLVFVHMLVNIILVWLNKKYNWKNEVFTIEED